MPETPYYVGPDLSVTSATVTYKASTAPVSAIASVSLQRVSREKIRWYVQGLGLGLAVIAGTVFFRFWYGLMGALGASTPGWLPLAEVFFALCGAAMVVLTLIGLVQAAGSKDVVVGLLSGEALLLRVPKRDANDVKRAVERAITSREVVGRIGYSAADELGKLAALRDSGVLLPDDLDRAKDMYLGKPADARVAAVAHLRGLYQLHQEGVLSLSEFNTKKWEVLAKRE